MLSHRNSYSAGSASAAYGFRPQVPSTQQTRSSNAPVRNGHSAEYEVILATESSTKIRHLGRYMLSIGSNGLMQIYITAPQ